MKSIIPGQVVEVNLPARLRLSTQRIPTDIRLTALILTFKQDGAHRDDMGTAADIDPATSKTELKLEVPELGDRQVLMLIGTRNGVEIPFEQLPQITVTVEDGTDLYSWTPTTSANKATIVLETYIKNERTRMRAVDQGYIDGWTSFCQRTGCIWDLRGIMVSTLADLQAPKNPMSDMGGAPTSDAALADRMLEVRRLDGLLRDMEGQITALRQEYGGMKSTYDQLVERVKDMKDAPEWAQFGEVGIYKPHFDYGDSEKYKEAILAAKKDQKDMVSNNAAVTSSREWTVGGDRRAGADMIKRQIKLTLRAFNGEADAAISGTRWNNVLVMEKRIHTAAESINKANESLQVRISQRYLALKIRELRLAYEYRNKVHEEREAAADLRREQREQDRLERELVKAEAEEQKYRTLLERARAEVALGDETPALREKISRLEAQVAAAEDERERAKAMAEITKCGFVYVISNVGSFGPGIVKIGMTRRLEPMDRIRELSSASVPFGFDTHLLFYSDKASELEAELHRTFDTSRVNTTNNRKEFFRVAIGEVEREVTRIIPGATFTQDPEAREWRETVTSRQMRLVVAGNDMFPATL